MGTGFRYEWISHSFDGMECSFHMCLFGRTKQIGGTFEILLIKIQFIGVDINLLLSQLLAGEEFGVVFHGFLNGLQYYIIRTIHTDRAFTLVMNKCLFFVTSHFVQSCSGFHIVDRLWLEVGIHLIGTDGHHRAAQCRTSSNKVSARFANNFNARFSWEKSIDDRSDLLGNLGEEHETFFLFFFCLGLSFNLVDLGFLVIHGRWIIHGVSFSRKSTTDIDNFHLHSVISLCHVKDFTSILESKFVTGSIAAARPHVKGNADDFQSVLFGGGQQRTPLLTRSSKFGTEAALTSSVVSDDAKNQFDFIAHGSAFLDFGNIVKGYHSDSSADGFNEMSTSLAWICINNLGLSGKVPGNLLDQSNFIARGTVKVASQDCKGLDNAWVGVAFY
mmetsp:Transcript_19593/g.36565  ORF Transcript_19593/g.36565 Transcript_19593/m.36565 type:complete len:388 (-) Transcript_19593:1705-2868(-)